LVDVDARRAVEREAGVAVARVAAGAVHAAVRASGAAAAEAGLRVALVDVVTDERSSGLAVALKAGLAGAREASGRVGAVGVHVAAAVVRRALVDVRTDQVRPRLAVALIAGLACAGEAA